MSFRWLAARYGHKVRFLLTTQLSLLPRARALIERACQSFRYETLAQSGNCAHPYRKGGSYIWIRQPLVSFQ